MKRRIGAILLAGLFAPLSVADAWQLLDAARGRHPDPAILLVTHAVTGALAAAVAIGSWRGRRWAAWAVLGWGAVSAAMLVALGPLLDTAPAERPPLWVGAAVVVIAAGAAARYFVRHGAR